MYLHTYMDGRRFEDTWAMEDAFARNNIPQNMRGLRRQCGPNNVHASLLLFQLGVTTHDPRFGQIALRPLPGYPAARLRQAASVAHPPQHAHRSTSIHVPVQLHFSRVTAFTTSPRARLLCNLPIIAPSVTAPCASVSDSLSWPCLTTPGGRRAQPCPPWPSVTHDGTHFLRCSGWPTLDPASLPRHWDGSRPCCRRIDQMVGLLRASCPLPAARLPASLNAAGLGSSCPCLCPVPTAQVGMECCTGNMGSNGASTVDITYTETQGARGRTGLPANSP